MKFLITFLNTAEDPDVVPHHPVGEHVVARGGTILRGELSRRPMAELLDVPVGVLLDLLDLDEREGRLVIDARELKQEIGFKLVTNW